jgi:hypothetical protein
MKVSCALATAVLLLLFAMPARAQIIYPSQWCRVYDDTALIQIPGQCGTVVAFRPRKLFVRAPKQRLHYYYR